MRIHFRQHQSYHYYRPYRECERATCGHTLIAFLLLFGALSPQILGIVLDLGGGPNHDRIGFRYWKNPGVFAQYDGIGGAKGRFLGWWAVMSQAAFSFIGTEIVAIAAGEVRNPRRNIPKACVCYATFALWFH